MVDREKVIKGLEYCLPAHDPDCDLCPYDSIDLRCRAKLRDDIIALLKEKEQKCRECGEATSKAIQELQAKLKEQEPIEPKIIDTSNSKLYHSDMFKNYYCGNCGEFLHVVNRKDLFCSQCGRAVKWK